MIDALIGAPLDTLDERNNKLPKTRQAAGTTRSQVHTHHGHVRVVDVQRVVAIAEGLRIHLQPDRLARMTAKGVRVGKQCMGLCGS